MIGFSEHISKLHLIIYVILFFLNKISHETEHMIHVLTLTHNFNPLIIVASSIKINNIIVIYEKK